MLNFIKNRFTEWKRVTKIIVLPTGEEASKTLNSKCSVFSTLNQSKDHRDGIIQYNIGINISPIKVETQFNGICIIEDVGSKTENRLVIIFKLNYSP